VCAEGWCWSSGVLCVLSFLLLSGDRRYCILLLSVTEDIASLTSPHHTVRKEGRALGEVTKYLVYNARKRGGDNATDYFRRTEDIAGVKGTS
jgi:hypothetical protein